MVTPSFFYIFLKDDEKLYKAFEENWRTLNIHLFHYCTILLGNFLTVPVITSVILF